MSCRIYVKFYGPNVSGNGVIPMCGSDSEMNMDRRHNLATMHRIARATIRQRRTSSVVRTPVGYQIVRADDRFERNLTDVIEYNPGA